MYSEFTTAADFFGSNEIIKNNIVSLNSENIMNTSRNVYLKYSFMLYYVVIYESMLNRTHEVLTF